MSNMVNEELARAIKELKKDGIDIAILSEPYNVTYVSGFEIPVRIGPTCYLPESPVLAIINTRNSDTCMIVPPFDYASAKKSCRLDNIYTYEVFNHFYEIDSALIFNEMVCDLLKKTGAAESGCILGLEKRSIPFHLVEMINYTFPSIIIKNITGQMIQARIIKTKREIQMVREASKLADFGQETIMKLCRPNMSEIELCNIVQNEIQMKVGYNIQTFINFESGMRTSTSAYPGGPIDKKLFIGDMCIYDLSILYHGFWADTTNDFVVGREPNIIQSYYFNVAKEAFNACIEAIKPGILACEVDRIARAVFNKNKVSIVHYCGHQVGTHVNDVPRFVCYDKTSLQEDMVFALEIGAYAGEGGNTGARCEKIVLVTHNGAEVLSKFKWGMEYS